MKNYINHAYKIEYKKYPSQKKYLQSLLLFVLIFSMSWGCSLKQVGGSLNQTKIEQELNRITQRYPKISFNKAAPDEKSYPLPFDTIWDQLPKLLGDMEEEVRFSNRTEADGLIFTNYKSVIKSKRMTLEYQLRAIVKKNDSSVTVSAIVPIIEKHFGATTKTDATTRLAKIIRHIFFSRLSEKLSQIDEPSSTPIVETPQKTITDLQKKLKVIGYNPGPIDNILGKRTRRAIRKFQRNHGLPATGEPNAEFWQILLEFYPD